jgi:hypothetical protein
MLEICDQLAVRVVVNLATQNRDEVFSLMWEWIKSGRNGLGG